ncbi:MAG: hypothetical protein CMF59_05960 [Leptospiraceae bacterium]|nr:hypothetical protein [Leptospiraceae bacterium]
MKSDFVIRKMVLGCFLLFPVFCTGLERNTRRDESSNTEELKAMQERETWFISPELAADIRTEDTILLDARHYALYSVSHISGASSISWKEFARENSGLLLQSDELKRKLKEYGIDANGLILVYGGSKNGWGEEGRITWMLRTLGYPAYVVDGGFEGLHPLLKVTYGPLEGQPDSLPTTHDSPALDAIFQRADSLTVTKDELNELRNRPGIILIDSRKKEEYLGATPYGESRGGHIPGAVHIYYQDLIREDGRILSASELAELLLSREAIRAALKNQKLDGAPGKRSAKNSSAHESPSDKRGALPGEISKDRKDVLPERHPKHRKDGLSDELRNLVFITYCTGGVRSAFVTAVLRHYGLQARNYPGSMWEWSAQPKVEFPLTLELAPGEMQYE